MSAERGLRHMLSARPSPLPTVLAVVVVLLLVALGSLAARSDAWVPPGSAPEPTAVSSPSAAPTTAPATAPPMPSPAPVDAGSGGWLVPFVLVAGVLLLLLLVGGLVALARATGRISWRRRVPGERAAGLTQAPAADPLPTAVHRALTEVTDQPDAREAVVRAWLLLGEAAAAAGTAPLPAETAGEYAERLAAAHDLPVTSVERLAGLYREARFSDHAVVAEQREAARTELLALQAALATHARDVVNTRRPA